MKKRTYGFQIILAALIVVVSFSSISATGGYFRHGYGVKYGAMAGALVQHYH